MKLVARQTSERTVFFGHRFPALCSPAQQSWSALGGHSVTRVAKRHDIGAQGDAFDEVNALGVNPADCLSSHFRRPR
jgi:hypothetical protein